MKISGFTIAKNIVKYHYPAKEAIMAVLPICDEFVINVGKSDDNTLEILRSIKDPKIKIIERVWDGSQREKMLSVETNAALAKCTGDWAFYVQTDELIHEQDLGRLKRLMRKYLDDPDVDALRFKWLHFYGSFYRYRIDPPWYQKQDRIIRNNGTVESWGDAYAFKKKDGSPLRSKKTGCYIYHYGWVSNPEKMSAKRQNAASIGFARLSDNEKKASYDYGNLDRFPVYFGTHPHVMKNFIQDHADSIEDWLRIKRKYFWSPLLWFRVRYKTFLRRKDPIPK
ncbi:MAG: glycosyltransferase family 2 protein [Candidatus Omnitrophica bacterium]|nr:glycosyltransferase family 2 protein [Candidatus Omnitrophota bacterium]